MALAGFMASGKSTIGRKLARKLSCAFVDTDALVVRAHGPIPAIFDREGEPGFRRYETAALACALEDFPTNVIALGGGTLTVAENRRLLRAQAHCIFIRVSPEQIFARVRRGRGARPLLGATPTLEQIRELYAQRMPQYAKADLVIDAARRSDAQVITEIIEWLGRRNITPPAVAS
ncbi:MAG TPA: shikimate kinase [Candidatus Cybelea sp.]|nr:shikimate kinase [Candidatus Cybelea sp.]